MDAMPQGFMLCHIHYVLGTSLGPLNSLWTLGSQCMLLAVLLRSCACHSGPRRYIAAAQASGATSVSVML